MHVIQFEGERKKGVEREREKKKEKQEKEGEGDRIEKAMTKYFGYTEREGESRRKEEQLLLCVN